jgi:flagellar basal body-associated protein FliL
MVAKLALVLAVLAIVLSVAVIAAYRYFKQKEEHAHEKEMFREKRDAELLSDQDSYIERELEREK